MSKLPAPLRACIDRFEEAVKDAAFSGTYHPADADAVEQEAVYRRKLLENAIARNIEKARKNAR